jgi:hypothetical protein
MARRKPGPAPSPLLLHLQTQAGRCRTLAERLEGSLRAMDAVPIPQGAETVIELERLETRLEKLARELDLLALNGS